MVLFCFVWCSCVAINVVSVCVLSYIIINLFKYVLLHTMVLFCIVWCSCMVINVVSVQHNGGFLPDIILLTQWYYHRRTRLNAMKRFCICSL